MFLRLRFFEKVFKYGGSDEKGPFVSPGPQYRRQNNNFDGGSPHVTHIGATAYAYLDSMWMFGYTAEMSVFPMVSFFSVKQWKSSTKVNMAN